MAEIKTMLIFEMIGFPKEHVSETLNRFLELLAKETGVSIIEKKINEPKRIEKSQKELYSTFAEAEVDFNDLDSLMKVAFSYMPSHIEILAPPDIAIKNFELNTFMNALLMKLHRYDELAKRFIIEKQILEGKLREKASGEQKDNRAEKEKTPKKVAKKAIKKKK